MFYSELVKGEKLLNPIAPPVVCKIEKTVLSIRPHTRRTSVGHRFRCSGSNDWGGSEDILYFDKVGERFRVFHEVEDGEWLWAQSSETGESGLLLAESVLRVEDERLHEIEAWYYADISKDDVRVILASAGSFSYLVRPSEQAPGNYTLFFNADVIHRYRISEATAAEAGQEAEADWQDAAPKTQSGCKYFQIGGRYFSR
jgi:hypothetical protein